MLSLKKLLDSSYKHADLRSEILHAANLRISVEEIARIVDIPVEYVKRIIANH